MNEDSGSVLKRFLINHEKMIEISILLISVVFIAAQTYLTRIQLTKISDQIGLEYSNAVHEHLQRINTILVRDENRELAQELFELEPKHIIAYMLLADYEALFLMKPYLEETEYWKQLDNLMKETVRLPFIRTVWEKENGSGKRGKHPRFVAYVDRILADSKDQSEFATLTEPNGEDKTGEDKRGGNR